MTDYTGRRVGNYRILKLVGSGGMGAVYLAEHILIGKKVAIKFLHSKFADSKMHQTLFLCEARAAIAVGHKNIVDIQDVGVSNFNEQYIVMEYLQGESVAELLARKGRLDLDTVCAILVPTLRALCAAHDKGIIHRDLKPDNILLSFDKGTQFEVKIIDFGISATLGKTNESGMVLKGKVSGTPAYMSPEQILGNETMDGRTDLYAIGVILYEMLTGRLPFKGDTPSSFLADVLSKPPSPASLPSDEIVPQLERLILQLLSKNPSHRPSSAQELLLRLQSIHTLSHENSVQKILLSTADPRLQDADEKNDAGFLASENRCAQLKDTNGTNTSTLFYSAVPATQLPILAPE